MLFICACLGGQGFVSAFDGRRERVTTHSGRARDAGKERERSVSEESGGRDEGAWDRGGREGGMEAGASDKKEGCD